MSLCVCDVSVCISLCVFVRVLRPDHVGTSNSSIEYFRRAEFRISLDIIMNRYARILFPGVGQSSNIFETFLHRVYVPASACSLTKQDRSIHQTAVRTRNGTAFFDKSVLDYRKITQIPQNYDHIRLPERPKLPILPKVPQLAKFRKWPRRLTDIRGPEMKEDRLIFGQYGVVALQGGYLEYRHLELIRLKIARNIDTRRMFAKWRVEAPYKPITAKGQGQRMGGGKGSIDHWATPVKNGRVIFEVGGRCEFGEVEPLLSRIAKLMPFDAIAVNVALLEERANQRQARNVTNSNPVTLRYLVENDYFGIRKYLGKYDKKWMMKH